MTSALLTSCYFRAVTNNYSKSVKGNYARYSTLTNQTCQLKKLLEFSNINLRASRGKIIRWFKTNNDPSSVSKRPNRFGLSPVQAVSNEPGNFRKLLRPFLFTVGVCGASFVGCTVWQYEQMRSDAIRHLRESKLGGMWKKQPAFKQSELRRHLNAWWNSLSDGQQLSVGIIFINVVVFGMWRVKSLTPFMIKYFTSNPSSKAVCLPMLLSTFSHFSLFHLAANMYVLFSFSNIAGKLFGKEQFLGVYLSAGVVSSFVSYVHKIATKRLTPSLGASGALFAILAPICFKFPDAQIAIVFLPFFTFPAGYAIMAVMGLDVAGLALGWRIFDHAAHLGGALFGIGYGFYGQELLWKNREPVMMWWHKIREGLGKS